MGQALGPSWSNDNQPNYHQRAPAISPASRHGRSSPSSNRMPGGWLGRDNGHGADDKLATSGNIQQQNAHQRLLHVASCCGPPHSSAAESGKKLWFGCIASYLTSSPRNSARLVDKGFTHCTGAYLNFLRAYFPAKVKNGHIDAGGIKYSRKQSADRYIVEVFLARVKSFLMFKNRATWATVMFLNDVWHFALAATNLNKHLRKPCDEVEVEEKLRASFQQARDDVLALRRKWPENKDVPSYIHAMVGRKSRKKEKFKQKLGLKCTNMQWLDSGPADRALRGNIPR